MVLNHGHVFDFLWFFITANSASCEDITHLLYTGRKKSWRLPALQSTEFSQYE